MADACEGLVQDLRELYPLPSVYLLVDGRLRCQASRDYYPVVRGFTPGSGVVGRVVATGVAELIQDVAQVPDFVAAIPGLIAEACVPVRVGNDVVGAISVECLTTLPSVVQEVLQDAAEVLAERIQAAGGPPAAGRALRLARVAIALSVLSDPALIYAQIVQAAIDISGMNSAALCLSESGGTWTLAGNLLGAPPPRSAVAGMPGLTHGQSRGDADGVTATVWRLAQLPPTTPAGPSERLQVPHPG